MSGIDWALFTAFLAYVVWDGARRGRGETASGYFLAGRDVPWWGMWLSIMATQASAITMIGTSGQGWADGMRFVQFYFSLPLAMVLIAVFAVPVYHRLQVSTAYEYLGVRFDGRVRSVSAVLFLILRGLSVGFVIFTPSAVLAKVLGWPLGWMVLLMGGLSVAYTAIGGLEAVIRTDVKQMLMMTLGLIVALVAVISRLPGEVGVDGAMALAGAADRLDWIDLSWDPAEKYTLWNSLLGGLFLFLAYFGTDQSQVQRLLSGRSVADTRRALLLNAVFKVPFQFAVLGLGVLLFVFYTFAGSPITFEPRPEPDPAMQQAEYRDVVADWEMKSDDLRGTAIEYVAAHNAGEDTRALGEQFAGLVVEVDGLRDDARELRGGRSDTHFVFLDFILTYLPVGVVGLLLAAIFAAAMSSIDSELNAMTTVAVLDIYQRARAEPVAEDRLVGVSRWATLLVGLFATGFALRAGDLGSLIEGVNKVGSLFYGSLLGLFLLAAIPRANATGALVGLVAGMAAVTYAYFDGFVFLWLNTIGVVVVVVVGTLASLAGDADRGRAI